MKQWRSWHCAATTNVKGKSADEILRSIGADYKVEKNPVSVYDWKTDIYQQVADRYVVGIRDKSGRLVNLDVVKNRYEIVPNSAVLQKAMDFAEHESKYALESVGTMDDGKKFFAVVSTGRLETVDIRTRVYPTVDTFMVIATSHDGSWPIMAFGMDVCNGAILGSANQKLKNVHFRHTPNWHLAESSVEDIHNCRISWSDYWRGIRFHLVFKAEPMTRTQAVEVLKDTLSPTFSAAIHDPSSHVVDIMRWASPTNDLVSRWDVYTAFCKWVDLYRPVDSRVNHMLDRSLSSHKMKEDFLEQMLPDGYGQQA